MVAEQILDFSVTARPGQRQHQQDPELLQVEFIGRHRAHRTIGCHCPFEVGKIFNSRDRSKHGVDRHRTRGVAGLRSCSRRRAIVP